MVSGKVRNGFVPHVRHELMAKMKALHIDVCPFANLPEKRRTQWALTRQEMKNCHWLKLKLVAQIEFTEWTPDGHLPMRNMLAYARIKKRGRWCAKRAEFFDPKIINGGNEYR